MFVFSDGFGNDIIVDFNAIGAIDTIHLSAVSQFTDADGLFANLLGTVRGSVTVTARPDTLTLWGLHIDDLDANDFIFG
ncbi:hypothetical protein GP644_12840 [Parasedimentitalea maritima]|uniref:Uncharacterized protein n=2 Tax=Parasedimentitalea maritima TaxID=2578117 RepID=A0A6A4RF99_9RHOB|nr:hypothetical protein [Zongyanglinia marina]KAE9629298.1 hypothetical protein GP644_12840 [Zongyanglinia marina]